MVDAGVRGERVPEPIRVAEAELRGGGRPGEVIYTLTLPTCGQCKHCHMVTHSERQSYAGLSRLTASGAADLADGAAPLNRGPPRPTPGRYVAASRGFALRVFIVNYARDRDRSELPRILCRRSRPELG